MPIIQVDNLKKTFTSVKKEPGVLGALKGLVTRQTTTVEAVKGVSFSIEQGELIGFLGPNGAGKTTTLKMLSGILHPTAGTAHVLGYKPWDRKVDYLRQISLVMGQKNQLWWDLPAIDSFALLKEIYEIPDADYKSRLDELTSLLDITGLLDTQVRKLSLGERMKCELVAALIYSPKVVYLDEPTIGLDVVSQRRIREFLKTYQKREGSTIVLTSHYLQDIQELCERVVIIDHGEVIFDNTLATLIDRYSDTKLIRLVFDKPVAAADLAVYGKVIDHDDTRATIEVARQSTTQAAAQVLTKLPVVDIAIDDAEAEEIIAQIFTKTEKT